MNLVVESMAGPLPGERPVEIVERKGLGHPDTICDALAEATSRALCRAYLERYGRVLHHNVDKVLLCGGAASPRFRGGQVAEPIEIILAGRVTGSYRGAQLPIEEIAIDACRAWIRAHLHALDPERHVRIVCRFRAGSADLVDLFDRGSARTMLANDTSIGVGFAPLSPLESTVLEVERGINGAHCKRTWPETGEDVKVMGIRNGESISLTIGCAFVSAYVQNAADYLRKRGRLAEAVRSRAVHSLRRQIEVALNAADNPARGSLYLTVTGTSAEAGDDGEVGRGNRINGLITPGRPMTLEAAAGKNPISHVGKLYNIAAGRIAQDLVSTVRQVTAAECALVSQIGSPINEPQLISIRIHTSDGRAVSEYAGVATDIARNNLSQLAAYSASLVAGAIDVY